MLLITIVLLIVIKVITSLIVWVGSTSTSDGAVSIESEISVLSAI